MDYDGCASFCGLPCGRRVLLRKLSYWRIAAFSVLILGVAAAGLRLRTGVIPGFHAPYRETGDRRRHHRRPRNSETDPENRRFQRRRSCSYYDRQPGGTTSERKGSMMPSVISRQETDRRRVAAWLLPVVISLPRDRSDCRLGNALVGSIGVLVQYPNLPNCSIRLG